MKSALALKNALLTALRVPMRLVTWFTRLVTWFTVIAETIGLMLTARAALPAREVPTKSVQAPRSALPTAQVVLA